MTEKNYNPQQKSMKSMQKQEKAAEKKIETAPVKKEVDENKKTEEAKAEENKKTEEKNEEKKEEAKKKEKKKRTEAVVNGKSVPISTLDSIYICTFIRKKTIPKAISDLEEVLAFKRAIPMKGEIPHRKGKIMAGRYPINAVKEFIKLLKSLQANANVNGMDQPVIAEAIANMAYRPFGRFGRVRRKRTHISIKVVEKKLISRKKK